VHRKKFVKRCAHESSLRFHIAGLRKALGGGKGGARYITTLAGRGYCFRAAIESKWKRSLLLRPVFEQLVEGSDTTDLKAAERLLATLG
jgi:DNA-binding winged helix-turn-helix (wHTH) protein